jgi:hypothetical protein
MYAAKYVVLYVLKMRTGGGFHIVMNCQIMLNGSVCGCRTVCGPVHVGTN